MADTTYTAGIDEDHVVKTTETDSELDLSYFINQYTRIKSGIQSLPKVKTSPDQETLDHWNSVVVEDGNLQKGILNNQAKALYEVLKPIYNAGLIPSKYNDEYQQLENYVNAL